MKASEQKAAAANSQAGIETALAALKMRIKNELRYFPEFYGTISVELFFEQGIEKRHTVTVKQTALNRPATETNGRP